MSASTHLKRCAYCGKWTDGTQEYCAYCGHEHDKEYKESIKRREERGDPRVPIIQVKGDDPVWMKIAKRPIQLVQLILYGIVAFLVYLTTIFAH